MKPRPEASSDALRSRPVPADASPRRGAAVAGRIALGVVPLLLAWSAYRGLLGCYFYNDDFEILYDLGNSGPFPFLFEPHLGHGLIVRNLLLWGMRSAFGVDASAWFATALAVHLLNTALLFLLVETLTGGAWLGALAATLFGISRTHEGTLGWMSASGHAMATVPLLVLLLSMARHDRRGAVPSSWTLVGWVLLAASSQCFGVALSAAPAVIIVARWFVPGLSARAHRRLVLATLAIVFGVYGAQRIVFPALPGAPIDIQRVPPMAILPRVAVAWLRLHIDLGFLVSPPVPTIEHGMLPNVVLATASAALLLVAVVRPGADRARRWIPGLFAVIAAAYLPIALTRTAFPDLQGVLRYHYVTHALIATALAIALAKVFAGSPARRAVGAAGCAGAVGILAWLLGLQPYPVDHHDVDRAESAAALARIDQAPRRSGEPVLVPNPGFGPTGSLSLFEPEGRFPGVAALYIGFRSSRDDPTIRFVSRSPGEYAFASRRGGRIATLLVPPDASTAGEAARR